MRLAKLVIAALLLWSLYWAAAAWGLRTGIAAWFSEQQRQGWQAEYAGLETSGYPATHLTRISRPALADPGTGTAWRADWLELESPAIWPGQLTLRFPASPQRLSYFVAENQKRCSNPGASPPGAGAGTPACAAGTAAHPG